MSLVNKYAETKIDETKKLLDEIKDLINAKPVSDEMKVIRWMIFTLEQSINEINTFENQMGREKSYKIALGRAKSRMATTLSAVDLWLNHDVEPEFFK